MDAVADLPSVVVSTDRRSLKPNIKVERSMEAMESALAALVNAGDWDFLSSVNQPLWRLMRIVQSCIGMAQCLKGLNPGVDAKKCCQTLVDNLRPVLATQSMGGGQKRPTDGGKDSEERQNILSLFGKLHHPGILQVISLATHLYFMLNVNKSDSIFLPRF